MVETAYQQPTLRQSLVSSARVAGVVLGTAVVVTIALRNSLTWYMEELWGASMDFWQSSWTKVYRDWLGESAFTAYLWLYPMEFVIFWVANAFFIVVELTGHPSVILQYKIQPAKKVPIDSTCLRQCLPLVLVNMCVVGPILHVVITPLLAWRYGDVSQVPSFHVALLQLAGCAIIEEIFFYYAHRLLHTPYFYKRFHKIHHEWISPISLASVYCHPFEHTLSNALPVAAGAVIMGCHPLVTLVWLWVVYMSTTLSHSGFHLPFMPSSEMHDYHHAKFNQNFGVLGVLDQLHGTNSRFLTSKEYERHFLLTSTTPARTLIPNNPKKCDNTPITH